LDLHVPPSCLVVAAVAMGPTPRAGFVWLTVVAHQVHEWAYDFLSDRASTSAIALLRALASF
jgi:hypothetical protein